jgi:hypothetical protein
MGLRETAVANDPRPSTADSRCRQHFDDFGPVLVSRARIGSAVQRGHQPDQPAGRSHEPHPLWSGRASSRSRLALRTVIVSPSQGDRLPQRKLFAVDHRLQQVPPLVVPRPRVHRSRPAPRPRKRRSADPVLPCPPMPGLGIHPRSPRRLLTHPSPLLLARIPTHRPKCALARSAVTLTVTSLCTYPHRFLTNPTSIHLLHSGMLVARR